MKDQIIAKLKEKYPKINLSKARLDAIADKLKVTEESEIEGKLEELNDIFPFAEIAKQDDRIRGLGNKDQKPADDKKPDSKTETNDSDNAEVPSWFKPFAETVPKLLTRLEAIENGKTVDTRKSQLEAKLKDATDAFKNTTLKAFNRMQFKDDEEFNAYLEEVETDAAEFVQTEANNGLSQTRPPITPKGTTTKQASKEELDAVMPNLV
ncbi:hypothetical protein EXU85_20390 [Spirosoma sp. KCTC 42546]|uniref:hypothetical protein n=1 Tax=Spirosoma sp. KCTC 42546 TaxID=2520506 RepID=UPI0011594B6D|nr:hypothetical protein [Spirosoma sp. KCTC 42546]QDK80839.1 hypothetical protein EXU85_20390 [Spirosoma sp. KCTC 42546]